MSIGSKILRAISLSGALLSFVVATVGCGSGFMEGWRDNSPNPSGIPPSEVCAQKDGYSWIDGQCVKNKDLDLTAVTTPEQCATIDDAYWVDDTCLKYSALNEKQCALFSELQWSNDKCLPRDRPAITFSGGALEQGVVTGAALTPIEFSVTDGAVIRIIDASCPGYFVVNGSQIVGKADVKPADGQNSCKAIVVADKNGVESDRYELKVTFSEGFLAYCANPATTDIDVYYFALRLADYVDEKTCDAADKALQKQQILRLGSDSRVVRVDALFGLTAARWLEITGHSIEDVKAISSLTGLVHLDLSSPVGQIKDISALAKLPNLKRLFLSGNPIEDGTVEKTEANCPTAAGTNAAVKEFCEKK